MKRHITHVFYKTVRQCVLIPDFAQWIWPVSRITNVAVRTDITALTASMRLLQLQRVQLQPSTRTVLTKTVTSAHTTLKISCVATFFFWTMCQYLSTVQSHVRYAHRQLVALTRSPLVWFGRFLICAIASAVYRLIRVANHVIFVLSLLQNETFWMIIYVSEIGIKLWLVFFCF